MYVCAQKGQGVYVHYSGYLLESGSLFDSSFERGKPLQFAVGTGRVIKVLSLSLSLSRSLSLSFPLSLSLSLSLVLSLSLSRG